MLPTVNTSAGNLLRGRSSAGLVTGWVSCLEGRYAPIFASPHVMGDTFVEVVDALVALPAE